MRRRELLVGAGALTCSTTLGGCAWLVHGPTPKGFRGDLRVGFLILDLCLALGVLFVSVGGIPITMPLGIVALVVDFASGAIFEGPSGRGGSGRDEGWDDDPDMTRLDLCPEAGRLVAESVPAPTLSDGVIEHLETCPHCAQALLALAPSDESVTPARSVVFRGAAARRARDLGRVPSSAAVTSTL